MNIYSKLPKPFFVLAPMDDVTDVVFRSIIASCAPPDLYFTEFVNVDGLSSPGREKLLFKLKISKSDKPIIAQLWGKDPDNYKKVAKELASMGFSGIDVNMGCPDKTVVKNGCCVALINNRELASEIIQATKEGAGSLPVSVKTRLGFNDIDYSWHEFLLKQDIVALTIHGRTKKELSKVPANWGAIEKIRKLRDQLGAETVIIGNGDVSNREEGLTLAKEHSLDGIMIGRGVLHDPFAFTENSPWENYDEIKRQAIFKRHVELFFNTYEDGDKSIHGLKKFAKLYLNNFPGAKELREEIMNINTREELLNKLSK